MKKTSLFAVVLVTAPSIKVARELAAAALHERLAACANIIPGLESHYWWKGKLEKSAETQILFKTTRRRLPALEKLVLAKHPYETPEVLVLTPEAGSERYLAWLGSACSE